MQNPLFASAKQAARVAVLLWNQWQASPGMGGSFRMESVADFIWNTHSGQSPCSTTLFTQLMNLQYLSTDYQCAVLVADNSPSSWGPVTLAIRIPSSETGDYYFGRKGEYCFGGDFRHCFHQWKVAANSRMASTIRKPTLDGLRLFARLRDGRV